MSKKNNHPFKTVSVALVVVALLSAKGAVWGQSLENPFFAGYDWAVTPVYGLVDIDCPDTGFRSGAFVAPVGTLHGWFYHPDYPNFLPKKTRKGNVIFDYFDMELENPRFEPQPGESIIVPCDVADVAGRLHDRAYGGLGWGYTKVAPSASIDISMHCHGYSTGYNTWIDMTHVLADEYEPTYRRDHLTPGAIFSTKYSTGGFFSVGNHSSRIEGVYLIAGTHDLDVSVIEKNRVSALYTKTFRMLALCPDKDNDSMAHLHTDPCDMILEDATDLPWLPYGSSFYRKLP